MNEILQQLKEIVKTGDYEKIQQIVNEAKKVNIQDKDIVIALSEGMSNATKEYSKGGIQIDSIFFSGVAFQSGVMLLQTTFEKEEKIAKVVLAVPDGPWTIGKDIVRIVLTANNYEVIDAGSDVKPLEIIKVTKENNVDIIAIGLYLSYRIHMLKEIVEELYQIGIRDKAKIIISGPATNDKVAKEVGADGYAKDAIEVLNLCNKFIKEEKVEVKVKEKFTSLDRCLTAIKLQPVDRVPLVPFSMTFSAKFANIKYKDFCQNGEAMAEAQIKAARAFLWDGVTIGCSHSGRFVEPIGAKNYYPEDDVPRLIAPAVRIELVRSDFKKLKEPEYYVNIGLSEESIKAVRIVKQELKDKFVIGWTEGPFQGIMLLFAANPVAIGLLKEEKETIKELMQWYLEYEFALAKRYKEAGADCICLSEPSGYFLSTAYFREWVYDCEKIFCERVKKELGLPVMFHCCGFVPQNIHFAKEVNPYGIINFDYQVNLAWAKALIGDKITIMGNIDCNRILHLSTPEQVKEVCKKAITDANGKNGGFFLSGGCEIPRDMPYQNMKMMLEACYE